MSKVLLDGLYDGESNLSLLRTRQHVMQKVGWNLSFFLSWLMRQVWENLAGNWKIFLAEPVQVEQGEEQVQPVEEEEQADNYMIQ